MSGSPGASADGPTGDGRSLDDRVAVSAEPHRKKADATPTRALTELLVELSVALHKHTIYPSGHQTLEPAAAGVVNRATQILESRELLQIGVAPHHLIVDDQGTDPAQPLLRRLAERLHAHHLAAVSLLRGLTPGEVTAVLRLLAAEPSREGPIGLAMDRLPMFPHLRLSALTFDRLALVDDVEDARVPAGGAGSAKADDLWIGLSRAAAVPDVEDGSELPEPARVARAIEQHLTGSAHDRLVADCLLRIALELKTGGAELAGLRERIGLLIAALKPETLRRLLEMNGDLATRRMFVLHAADGMAAESVLEIVRAAATVSGQSISHSLLRMLSKFASHAAGADPQVRAAGAAALRESVARLLDDWKLPDPNPGLYTEFLQTITAAEAPVPVAAADDGKVRLLDPIRVVQMSLETQAHGPMVDQAVEHAVKNGDLHQLLHVLDNPPEAARPAAAAILERLRQPATIAALLAREPVDFDAIDQLLASAPCELYRPLIAALAASENRATRRKLLERLLQAGPAIVPIVAQALADGRWFVQRNMLVLLERIGRFPDGFSAKPWVSHPDARVRQAAIRLQLAVPGERLTAVSAALSDEDPRLVRTGLLAIAENCPSSMLGLLQRVATASRHDDELRVLAVRTLGQSREGRALEMLLDIVNGGKTLLGRPRLAPRTPAMLAALEALACGWPAHPLASALIALAAKSRDPEIRQAAARTES